MEMAPQRLRDARHMRGWSQARVADMLGTSAEVVGRWERGVATPSPYFREKLCQMFESDAFSLGLASREAPLPMNAVMASTAASALPENTGFSGVIDPALPLTLRGVYRLIGRTALLMHLEARLCSAEHHPVIALYGLPGIGKTSVATAIAYAAAIRAQYADGVLWASLGPQPQPLHVLSRWGTLLGMTTAEQAVLKTLDAWREALRRIINQRRFLVILDDIWDVETAIACQISGNACVTLLTTRSPEIAFALAPDGACRVPELTEAESLTLLMQWDSLEATPQIREMATAVAQKMGGLPLALTLLGHLLRKAAQHGQPRRLHTVLAQMQRPEVPLSLAASIAMSVQPLLAEQQGALYALGVFPPKPNTFSEAAALAIGACSCETLDVLVDGGLVESRGPGRYSLHQTIADYARMQQKAVNCEAEVIQRFTTWVLASVTHHCKPMNQPDGDGEKRDRYREIERESVNIFAGLEIMYSQGDLSAFLRGTLALQPFLLARGCYATAASLLERAYLLRQRCGGLLAEAEVGELCWRLGQVARKRGQYQEAEQYIREGQAVSSPECIAIQLLGEQGSVREAIGDYEGAEQYWWEGLQRAQSAQAVQQAGVLLMNLGVVALRGGQWEQSKNRLSQALSFAQQAQDQETCCAILSNLGALAGIAGDYETAATMLQEGATLARARGYRVSLTGFLGNLARLARLRGDANQAEHYYQEGITLVRRMGYQERLAELLANLGGVYLAQGKVAAAAIVAQEGIAIAEQLGHSASKVLHLGLLGAVAVHRKDFFAAETCYQQGIALAHHLQDVQLRYALLSVWGEFLLDQQRSAEAEAVYHEILQMAQSVKSQAWQAEALFGLAQLARTARQWTKAHTFGQESLTLFTELGHVCSQKVQQFMQSLSSVE